MKRFIIVLVLMAATALAITGCTGNFSEPNPDADVNDSCVTCHSDKDMLIAVATIPEEPTGPEEASGEG
jgi:hypothetical protein